MEEAKIFSKSPPKHKYRMVGIIVDEALGRRQLGDSYHYTQIFGNVI